MELTTQLQNKLIKAKELYEQAKELYDNTLEKAKQQMKEKGITKDIFKGYILTLVAPIESERLDTEKLKTDYLSIYTDCLKKTTSKESIRFTKSTKTR